MQFGKAYDVLFRQIFYLKDLYVLADSIFMSNSQIF